jgi:ABC-type nitrate/sulfonate/bicarbonate transport system substrate-binding protein
MASPDTAGQVRYCIQPVHGVLGLLLAASLACAGPGAAPISGSPATRPAAAAAPAETVRIGIPTRGLSALPLFAMQQRGLAAAEGLAVEIIQLRGSTSLPALLNGEIDYNSGWGPNTDGLRQGAPLKLLAFAVDRPMHYVVVRPEINDLAELRGKRVAVSRVGGTDYRILSAALARAGVHEGEVEQLFGGDDPVRLQLLFLGQVEGTTLVPPGLVVAKRQGMRLVVAGAELRRVPTFALAATERKLAEQPDQVVRVLRALVRALQLVQAEGATLAPIVAELLGVDEDVAAEAIQLALPAFSRDGSLPEPELAALFAEEGLDTQAVDWRFLQQAHRTLRSAER